MIPFLYLRKNNFSGFQKLVSIKKYLLFIIQSVQDVV